MKNHTIQPTEDTHSTSTKTPGFSAAAFNAKHAEHLSALYQLYPGVPDPHPQTWDRSDTELPQNEEWQKQLQVAAAALRHATEVCEQLAARSERTARNQLINNKTALLCAIHKAEDLVDELSMFYPLPAPSNYRIARSHPELTPRTPTLLYNNSDRILIWMPRLPSKKRGTVSVVFQEFQELLLECRFAPLNQWHCDFLHVYHPDHLTGILDVDNYCYKPVIDALTLALSTCDSFDHFSFSAFNFCHSTLKPGCYIHICNRHEKVDFFQKIIPIIQSKQKLQRHENPEIAL